MATALTVTKCKCGSSWCISCFKQRSAKKISERLHTMKWRNVRALTLTCDPRLWDYEVGEESGYLAYTHIMEHKYIPQLIHNLNRTKGAKIIDWLWVLEWHRNGFPHWHLYCEVEKSGKAGMIGADNIRHYWTAGAIREEYIRNQRHWDSITGYFSKHGYFSKDKAHQARLPEWAKYDILRKIRKYGCKRQPVTDELVTSQVNKKNKADTLRRWEQHDRLNMTQTEKDRESEKKMMLREPYCIVLDRCGSAAQVMVETDGFVYGCMIHAPYEKVIGWLTAAGLGQFVPHTGYVAGLTEEQMDAFEREFMRTSNKEMLEQLNEIEDVIKF